MAKGTSSRGGASRGGSRISAGKGIISGATLRQILKTGAKVYGTYKKYENPQGKDSKGSSLGIVTNQYDTSLMYKKKKKLSKKKITFANKVKRVIKDELGDQSLVRSLLGQITSTSGTQGIVDYSFWGCYDIGNQAHDDTLVMFTGYTGAALGSSSNFILPKSANFDFIVSNTGTSTAMVKVWYVYAKKDTLETPNQIWSNMASRQTGLPAAASMEGVVGAPTAASPNLGPYISLDFTRNYTIGEVRKYVLSPGQVASWRDTSTYHKKIMNMDAVQYNFRKGTKFVMITFHGVNTGVGEITSLASCYPSARIGVALQKTYKFAVLRDQYSTSSSSNNTA